MKRILNAAIATGMALTLAGAPLAMAQNMPPPPDHRPAPQHVTIQHETVQHNVVQHNFVQHVTVQHTTIQHVAVQHPPVPPHPMGYGGFHEWRAGDHYTGNRVYVSDWQAHHLRQPPSGYQWVDDNGQYVLIAVATGIISSVILNAALQ